MQMNVSRRIPASKHYEVDAQIGGKLAQLGGRLINSTSKKLAGEFFAFGEVVGAWQRLPRKRRRAGWAS